MEIEIIKSPSEGVLRILKSRSAQNEFFEDKPIDAVGLVQGKLAEMFVATDIAEKAADVKVVEIRGMCPQHFTMIAVLGDTSAVNEALANVASQHTERRNKKW